MTPTRQVDGMMPLPVTGNENVTSVINGHTYRFKGLDTTDIVVFGHSGLTKKGCVTTKDKDGQYRSHGVE